MRLQQSRQVAELEDDRQSVQRIDTELFLPALDLRKEARVDVRFRGSPAERLALRKPYGPESRPLR